MSQLLILRQFHLNRAFGTFALNSKNQQFKTLSIYNILHQQRKQSSGLQKSSARTEISTDVRPLGEKIKENTKTASYTAIILAGIGVTGALFYAIFRELFSGASPNNIYSNALELVKNDVRVQDALGAPIKGFGEESRRGRRQHVAHSTFERNGVPHMRMQFYVQGLRNKATVHLESRTTPSGNQEYRYLFVQLNYYPHTTIILEDNRALDPTANSALLTSSNTNSLGSLDFASFDKKK